MPFDPVSYAMGAKSAGGGSGGGVLVVHLAPDGDYWVCDKTATEIWTAAQNSSVSFMLGDSTAGEICTMTSATSDPGGFTFNFGSTGYMATAASGSDYPRYVNSGNYSPVPT